MKLYIAKTKKLRQAMLDFRRKLYSQQNKYVDNNCYMLKEIFSGKLSFTENMSLYPLIAAEKGRILCCAVAAYTDELPEYLQICFFEALPHQHKAVKLLMNGANKLGVRHGCRRIVVGLSGHVNYGLGLLDSHYDEKNSFSSPGNPAYYNDYFRSLGCKEIKLNSYFTASLDDRLMHYNRLLDKLGRSYEFKPFDKKHFKESSRIYTDLNNACFSGHRYYYKRRYEDDLEMLKALFMFIREDSVIFTYKDGKPVGFIMWYPDFNELAKPGEAFGAKHFFLNRLNGRKIRTAKVMEYGVLKEYRSSGLPLALISQVYDRIKDHGCTQVETSWILDENADSNSFCKALCDKEYKRYVVYEKEIV